MPKQNETRRHIIVLQYYDRYCSIIGKLSMLPTCTVFNLSVEKVNKFVSMRKLVAYRNESLSDVKCKVY